MSKSFRRTLQPGSTVSTNITKITKEETNPDLEENKHKTYFGKRANKATPATSSLENSDQKVETKKRTYNKYRGSVVPPAKEEPKAIVIEKVGYRRGKYNRQQPKEEENPKDNESTLTKVTTTTTKGGNSGNKTSEIIVTKVETVTATTLTNEVKNKKVEDKESTTTTTTRRRRKYGEENKIKTSEDLPEKESKLKKEKPNFEVQKRRTLATTVVSGINKEERKPNEVFQSKKEIEIQEEKHEEKEEPKKPDEVINNTVTVSEIKVIKEEIKEENPENVVFKEIKVTKGEKEELFKPPEEENKEDHPNELYPNSVVEPSQEEILPNNVEIKEVKVTSENVNNIEITIAKEVKEEKLRASPVKTKNTTDKKEEEDEDEDIYSLKYVMNKVEDKNRDIIKHDEFLTEIFDEVIRDSKSFKNDVFFPNANNVKDNVHTFDDIDENKLHNFKNIEFRELMAENPGADELLRKYIQKAKRINDSH